MNPIDLDKQSPIKIDRWIDVDSEEWREKDDTPAFTKKCLRYGLEENGFFILDSLGRVWAKPNGTSPFYIPFHFNLRGKTYGYRLTTKAAN